MHKMQGVPTGTDRPHAPVDYDEFRTGYTFADVYHMLYNRKWKRRHGVLGYWRQLKLAMYAEYLRTFDMTYTPSDEEIPE